MAVKGDRIEMTIHYTPDLSDVKKEISELSKMNIVIDGKNMKKDLISPLQSSMKEINKAINEGADSKTILKMYESLNRQIEEARKTVNRFNSEMNASYNSEGNKKMLKDLEGLRKEYSKVQKDIDIWDKTFGKERRIQLGITGINDARKQIEDLESRLDSLTDEDKVKLSNLKSFESDWNTKSKSTTKTDLVAEERRLRNLIEELEKSSQSSELNAQWAKNYGNILSRLSSIVSSLTKDMNGLNTAIENQDKAFEEAQKEAKSQATKIGDIFAGTFLGTSVSNMLEDALQRGIEFFKEYDETLTRTMMVTGMTREEVNGLTESYNNLANELSSTTKDVAAAQLVFYQQGLGTKEALAMTEASIAISKTGGIEAAEAADRLTAAVRGYQLAASDAMDIADKMSALDAAAASSVDELTVAMQKSASQAKMAGLDLDYYMAYLSTMQEVTREAPENIGTAMKSITSRIQEITDIGKVEEDGTTFSNVAKALNSIGIAAVDTQGQLRPLQEILNELGPMWATLDRNHQAYIATVLAGNRQQSRFIALMDNYDRALELVDVSQNANGESAKQLRAYNQGLEASFTRLSNAWQQFATKIADSDMIKDVVDLLTDLIEIVNKLPKGLTSTVTAFIALNTALKTIRALSTIDFKQGIANKLGIDKETLNNIKGFDLAIGNIGKKITSWTTPFQNVFTMISNGFSKAKEDVDLTSKSISTLSTTVAGSTGIMTPITASSIALADSANKAATGEEGLANAIEKVGTSAKDNDEHIKKEIQQNNQLADSTSQAVKSTGIAESYYKSRETSDIAKKEYEDITKKDQDRLDSWFEKVERTMSPEDAKAVVRGVSFKNDKIQKNDQLMLPLEGESDELLGGIFAENNIYTKYPEIVEEYYDILEELGSSEKRKKELEKIWTKSDKESIRYLNMMEEIDPSKKIDMLDTNNSKSVFGEDNLLKDFIEENIDDAEKVIIDKTKGKGNIFSSLFDFSNIGNNLKDFKLISNAFSGFATGAMGKMIADLIPGMNDQLSDSIGLFTGLGSVLGKIHPAGWLVSGAIGALNFGFKSLYPSIEDIEKKLTDLYTAGDKLKQTTNDISSALDSYKSLRNNLNRTEEEQEEFNNSIEVLKKEIPGIVNGYNSMGEATLNLGKATDKLNDLQEETIANAKKIIKEFDAMQKSEGTNGWTIAADIFSVFEYIGAFPFKLFEDMIGKPITLGGMIQDSLEKGKVEANKKVIEENYSEIFSQYQTIMSDFVEKGSKENSQQKQKIADAIINNFLADAMNGASLEETDLSKLQDKMVDLFDKMGETGLDTIVDISDTLSLNAEITGTSWNDLEKKVTQQVKQRLKYLDLTEEEIDSIIKVTMNASWDLSVNIGDLQQEIDRAIEEAVSDKVKSDLTLFKDFVGNMDMDMAQLLDDLGLLNVEFASLFARIGGGEELNNKFRDENGEIDKTRASLVLLNEAYAERKRLEAEVNGENNNKVTELEAKIAELEEKRDNLVAGTNTNQPYTDFGAISTDPLGDRVKLDVEINTLNQELEKTKRLIEENNILFEGTDSIISSLLDDFEYIEAPSFDTLSEDISNISSQFKEIFDLAESLDESGGKMSLDNFSSLFDIVGQFEEASMDMTDPTQWELWNSAIGKINSGLSEQNGLMMAEESVMEGLNELVAVQAKLKMQEHLATIDANASEIEYQNQILQTQLEAVKVAIDKLENNETTVAAEDAMYDHLDKLDTTFNAQRVARDIKTNNTILTYTAEFASKYSKIIAAAKDGKYTGEVELSEINIDNIVEELKGDLESELGGYIIDGNEEASLKNLKQLQKNLEEQIGNNNKTISNTLALKRKISDYLADETTNLAGAAAGYENASDAASDYNEKLERTLTLIEKIQGLEHTIDENETLKSLYEGYDGEDYGRILVSNLKLAKEQYEVYKDLFDMQQEMTNQAAGDLLDSPYGEMFKIAENGDIGWASDKMYEKYKGLPNDMQEDIDNLVEAYQEQRDELRDTEKELSVYAEAVKNAREELVEMEIEVENELLDAIKNREQILHDARIKALEDEIDMIDKAVEARQKAREEQDDADSVYEAQEALRRATLDSSGKNNAQLLQLQQDLEDKQLEISEKRFENDMEDRKNWLQDSIDAEQEAFDYRLENMTWYWEQVQIIQEQGTQAMMETLIMWNEEYRTTSDLQQKEMRREWEFTMDAMKKAADMGVELDKLTSDIVDVTNEVESMNVSIEKLPGNWKKATKEANSYIQAAKAASGYKITSTPSKTDTPDNDGKDDNGGGGGNGSSDKTKTEGGPLYKQNVGGIGNLRPQGYMLVGNKMVESKLLTPQYSHGNPLRFKADYYYIYSGDYYYSGNGRDWYPAEHLRKYLSGGIVDYTGPAWVDGTTTKPEAFLNSYQTEKIGALAESISNTNMNSLENNSTINFGSISFNVASMSSSADGKKALETFVQGANDIMAKKGINTKLNLNIK